MSQTNNKIDITDERHIFASFILRGPSLNPNNVTTYLGIIPTKSFSKGELRSTGEKWKGNFWCLRSQDKVDSNDLVKHIEWLIDQLGSRKEKIKELIHQGGIYGEISCFWIMPSDHGDIVLTQNIIKKISEFEVEVSFDIYSP